MQYHWDKNNSRLNIVKQSKTAKFNWFFIPGGAGLDARYLYPLIQAIDYPGICWTVDFPGNGDNITNDKYEFINWKNYLVDIITSYKNPIIVGHSFGGMLTLMEPKLESYLKGLILINSSPKDWSSLRNKIIKDLALPTINRLYQDFRRTNSKSLYQKFIKCCLPHLFCKEKYNLGYEMLLTVPYNFDAYDWWMKIGPQIYDAQWVPKSLATLILCGEKDYVTPPQLFTEDKRFHRHNVKIVVLPNASHFCWFDSMKLIKEYISNYIANL